MGVCNISDVLMLLSTIFVIVRFGSVQCYISSGLTNQFLTQHYGSAGATSRINDATVNSTSLLNKGTLIFEENFDSLNKSRWTREVKIPTEPDYEFCAYHGEEIEESVEVKDGIIRIKPLMLNDFYRNMTITSGQLNFRDCTSRIEIECARQAASFFILPPIISARLSTKNSFSFKYGKIEIRAKFPVGDWLYPEMWLEPKNSIYGTRYYSGRILLGLARGNQELVTSKNLIYDSRRLDFGIRFRLGTAIKEHTVSKIYSLDETLDKNWHGLHTYTTIWTAEGFQFFIDGEEVGRLTAEYRGRFTFQDPWTIFSRQKRAAPFNEEFYITIGVGVGGVRVFPDHTVTNGIYPKPWRNIDAKALLKFWNARNLWLIRWQQIPPISPAFHIDYIRVWSL